MCNFIKSYDWDSSDSEGKSPNPTPLPHVRLWVKYAKGHYCQNYIHLSQKIPIRLENRFCN